jgi:hypothetical protein
VPELPLGPVAGAQMRRHFSALRHDSLQAGFLALTAKLVPMPCTFVSRLWARLGAENSHGLCKVSCRIIRHRGTAGQLTIFQ